MFSDRAKLSDYSKSYVAEAVKQGYINGYTNGTFKPQGTLSRGEIAKMLYGYMGTSLNKNGNVYSQATLKSDTKNVTISVPCTLADADIKGNLYITEGVLAGNVTLEDVTVAGDIIVSGGQCNAGRCFRTRDGRLQPDRTDPAGHCDRQYQHRHH